jgi:hypothetical protein
MCSVSEVSSCLSTAAGSGGRLREEDLRVFRAAAGGAVLVPGVAVSEAVPGPFRVEPSDISKLTADYPGPFGIGWSLSSYLRRKTCI